MDQQTHQHFQTVDQVVSERVMARGRSSQKDSNKMLSPKQNVVYVRTSNPNNQQNSQATYKPPSQFQVTNMKMHEVVKVVDHSHEVEHYRNKCIQQEKQINEMNMEIHRLRNTAPQEKVTYIEDTQRLQEFERQISAYQQEINRVTSLYRESSIELEKWRNTHQQQVYNKQNTDNEFERLKRVSKENEQYLQNEIQRLSLLVQQSQSQLQQLQQTLIETKKYEGLYHQQQSTQGQLATELERITCVLKQKSEEFEVLRAQSTKEVDILQRRCKENEVEIKEMRGRETNYTIQIERLTRDLNDCNDRFSVDIRNKNDELNRLTQVTQTLQTALQDTSKYNEYEMRSKMHSDEIGILNQRLRTKQEESDKYKSQVHALTIQVQDYSKYSDYETKYTNLIQENDRITNNLRLKVEENDHLRSCIAKLQITLNDKGKIEDYENKIALLSQEIERLHQSLRSKHDEIDHLRNDNQAMNNELNRLDNILRNQHDELDKLKQNKDQSQKVTMLTTEIERLTSQLRNKNDEIEKVRSTLAQFQYSESQRLKELEQKNLVYSNEIERLSNLIKVKLSENESVKSESARLAQRLLLVCGENERLSVVVRQLQEDMEVSRKQAFNNDEKQVLLDRISTIGQELDSWKQQFITLNREFHKNQESLILANAELDSQRKKPIKSEVYENRTIIEQKKLTSTSSQQYQIGTLTSRNI